MLNGQPMGGKRRSAYFYDLWCMKYLPKFKWDHLTGAGRRLGRVEAADYQALPHRSEAEMGCFHKRSLERKKVLLHLWHPDTTAVACLVRMLPLLLWAAGHLA